MPAAKADKSALSPPERWLIENKTVPAAAEISFP